MFKFRGQSTLTGEWVTGWHFMDVGLEIHYILSIGVPNEVHKETLSISFGKLDSNKQEIFASFEIDGVMTTGGDVVELKHIQGKQFKVQYSAIGCEFIMQRPDSDIVWNVSNAGQFEITIIGKGVGNDK